MDNDYLESAIWSDESFLPDADSFDEPSGRLFHFRRRASSRHSVPAAAASGAFHSNYACHKTILLPAKRRSPSPRRRENLIAVSLLVGLSLVVAFFCLFQALPRWSSTDWPVIMGDSTSFIAPSASFDTYARLRLPRRRGETTEFFNIEDIRAGQLVLASNPTTGQLEPRRVLQTFRRTTYHLRHLTFASTTGAHQTFETTDEHPFLQKARPLDPRRRPPPR